MKKILLRSLAFSVFFASLLMLFSILSSSMVSASCCINANSKSCSFVPDSQLSTEQCDSAGGVFEQNSCSTYDACKIGCCCEQRQAMAKISCTNQNSFQFNEALGQNYQSGETCTCGSAFPISGIVYDKNGLPLGGATVTVGDKVTTTSVDGANIGFFILSDVPSGSKVVTASKDGCQASVAVEPFLSEKRDVSINLICNCVPGCDINRNSYCDGEQRVHFYNLDNVDEEEEYCEFCGTNDAADCGGSAPLCQNNDHYCPLGCTATGGPNPDSDCNCNPTTPNGVCPVGCANAGTNKDIDCGYSPNIVCGDHEITYPFETCEVEPLNNGQISSCNPLSCSSTCQCNSNSLCGNNRMDPGEACEGSVCSDGSPCNGCKCNQVCSPSTKNPVLGNLIYNKTTSSINLQWSLSTNCTALVANTKIYGCYGTSAECSANSGNFEWYGTVFEGSSFSVDSPSENTQYFFYVEATYKPDYGTSLGSGKSAIKSIRTGDYFCMNRPTGALSEFCLENKKTRCDANFNLQIIEDCTISDVNRARFCVGPDLFNQVSCQESNPCLSCNGLYGLFAKYIDLKIPIGSEDYFCSYNSQNQNNKVVPNCYFEQNNGFIVGSFKTCDKVKSCYDFKSKDSCTDSNDPCGLNAFSNKGCEWAPLGTSQSLGVCRPKDVNIQDCTVCDDPLKNPLSAKCTPQACSLFGTTCNFQGAQNTPSCSSNSVKTCNSYATIEQCIGKAPNARTVSVNAVYDSNKIRIGGTHVLTPSLDNSSLGKCYWDSDRCRRNADNLPVSAGVEGFDCQNNPGCESDFVNPVTTITYFTRNANPVFKYAVSDNFHPANSIKTFFCITPSGSACYPTEQGIIENGERVYKPGDFSGTQHYTLFYYSEDGSKNLEPVNQMNVLIDANEPFVELISPRNDSQIAVNTNELKIIGKTSADVLVVCAKNTANGFVTCLNRCDLGVAPCIVTSDSGADFNITVRINATSGTPAQLISNVIIEATDFVGNKFSNSLNGIIFDITPPREPRLRKR